MERLRDGGVVLQFDGLDEAGFVAVGVGVHCYADAGVGACDAGGCEAGGTLRGWGGEGEGEEGKEGEGEGFHGDCLSFWRAEEDRGDALCFT